MSRGPLIGALGLLLAALAASTTFTLRAEPRPQPPGDGPTLRARGNSVQDTLLHPFDFPFAKPTPLSEVVEHLAKELRAPVVLDLAGLGRVDVRPDDTLTLNLRGVRLKTGLKLLLDQLDLTYKVEEEDNLLVITDLAGAEDALSQVHAELKEIHRDIHDLQDAVEDVRGALGLDGEGPMMRKPTIIEEVPENAPDVKPAEPEKPPPARGRPGI